MCRIPPPRLGASSSAFSSPLPTPLFDLEPDDLHFPPHPTGPRRQNPLPVVLFGAMQASTMRILKKYVRVGAPMFVPLSPSCREEMLKSRASSATIFDRARQEVMEKLGGGRVTYCVSLHRDTPTSKASVFFCLLPPTTSMVAATSFPENFVSLREHLNRSGSAWFRFLHSPDPFC